MNVGATRPDLIRIVLSALVGAVLVTAFFVAFVPRDRHLLQLGLNGCIPPCPQTTVVISEDWSGHRWRTMTTVDNGKVIGTQVFEENPPFYLVFVLAAGGAAVGGAVGLWAVRRQKASGDGWGEIAPT